jgi:hypothetical protein
MDVFTDNPLAVLHFLCALVALLSGLTVRLFGWRGRPPGGSFGLYRGRSVPGARPLARRWRGFGAPSQAVAAFQALRYTLSSAETATGDDACSPLLA